MDSSSHQLPACQFQPVNVGEDLLEPPKSKALPIEGAIARIAAETQGKYCALWKRLAAAWWQAPNTPANTLLETKLTKRAHYLDQFTASATLI